MNRMTNLVIGLAIAATLTTFAQQRDEAPAGDRPPPPRDDAGGRNETLTDAQVQQVKAILAKYDAKTLTAEQAKAVHEAFRQAGIRGGPAMNEAVKTAGFDPDKLRDLAPPPGRAG